ncbi:MAG: flagellar M-ring protein FliF [Pseudomonadales bacterium]|nr:flagellar M-ring protein FliF [Pseudomonadales bacterium]
MASIANNSTELLGQLRNLSHLPLTRQIAFMLLLSASIALGASIVMWSTGASYTPLYADLQTEESAEIVAALDQLNVPYRIEAVSGLISVPSDQLQQVRLQLANQGLPENNSQGFGILNQEQDLGISNFIEQARFNRALEQELAATIRSLQGVRNSRVHLSIPKQTSFIRSSAKPSASVMVDLITPNSLGDTQISGIVHLVSSSVAGLESDSVSVVDQQGNLLSQNSDTEFSGSSEHIRLTRQLEQEYRDRIVTILSPVVGLENVRAQVAADLDFTIMETTEESYDPNSVVVRSEQTQQEQSGANTTAVDPGSLQATPPLNQPAPAEDQATAANSSQSRVNSIRNYEIDRSVSQIRTAPGDIRKLSVAVLIDLNGQEEPEAAAAEDGDETAAAPAPFVPDQAKLDRLTQLVRDAIGYDELRGDSVSVIHEDFVTPPPMEELAAPPIWQAAWVGTAARYTGASVVVLLLIFSVLKPAMQATVAITPKEVRALREHSDEGGNPQVTLSGAGDAAALPAAAPPQSNFDQNLTLAKTLVQNEPARAARMIQNWLINE